MSLPLSFGWETFLVLLTGGFAILSIAAGATVAIHKNNLHSAKYLVVLCMLWAVVEFVQLFVDGFSMSGGDSNFSSSYLLLAAVTTTLSFYFPVSLMANYKVRSRHFVYYLIPLLLLCAAYTYVWYFDVAQEHRYYAFPDVWHNDFTWDLLFCIVCFFYIIANAVYVISMAMMFAGYLDGYISKEFGETHSAKKWLHDMAYMLYALIAFFILYLSQGTVEFAVTYKLAMLVIIPTVFVSYIYFAERYSSSRGLHYLYNIKWSVKDFAWEVEKYPEVETQVAKLVSEEMKAEEDSGRMEAYRQRLDEWMKNEKPYLKSSFKIGDVYAYLDIDRFLCRELFAKYYQCYFHTWVLHYRMDYAVDLMKKHPEKQIKTIALESGFSSQAVFARSFLNFMGMSCTEYKRQYL